MLACKKAKVQEEDAAAAGTSTCSGSNTFVQPPQAARKQKGCRRRRCICKLAELSARRREPNRLRWVTRSACCANLIAAAALNTLGARLTEFATSGRSGKSDWRRHPLLEAAHFRRRGAIFRPKRSFVSLQTSSCRWGKVALSAAAAAQAN